MSDADRLPPVIHALKAGLEQQGHAVAVLRNRNGDRRYRIDGSTKELPGDVFIRRAEAMTTGRPSRRL